MVDSVQKSPMISLSLEQLRENEPLLLGISGGADSVALLYLLLEKNYKNLILCHYNHQLRGPDSDNDAFFVKELANVLQLPFESGTGNVQQLAADQGISLETAAREARYQFFAKVAETRNVSQLVLAHHSDDQVETCFFNFLRGSGIAGLAGMQPSSSRTIGTYELTILRPLLHVTKSELVDYLQERKLSFRHDKSNDTLIPTRNRFRHLILPLLDECVGTSYRKAIARTATLLAAEHDYLESLAAPYALAAELSTKMLLEMPLALRRRVLHAWLRYHGFSEVSFAEVERVASLLNLQGAAKVNLPNNHYARRRAGVIFLEHF